MLRFTIRDVLWLTVVVAIVVAWRIEHRSDVRRAERERMVHAIQAREMEGTIHALQENSIAMKQQLEAILFLPRDEGADRSVKTDP